jgi:hypothetical protein
MEESKVLRLIYTFFVGIFLALFVGVGINTFYEPPAPPKYPIELNTLGKEPTAAQITVQREFDRKNEKYQEVLKPYNRNVSVMTLAAAVALLVGSVLTQKRIRLLADGIMLGGLFTLLYSIGRGFASDNSKYVFGIVTVGLIIVLYLGYYRLVRDRQPINAA